MLFLWLLFLLWLWYLMLFLWLLFVVAVVVVVFVVVVVLVVAVVVLDVVIVVVVFVVAVLNEARAWGWPRPSRMGVSRDRRSLGCYSYPSSWRIASAFVDWVSRCVGDPLDAFHTAHRCCRVQRVATAAVHRTQLGSVPFWIVSGLLLIGLRSISGVEEPLPISCIVSWWILIC